MRTFVHRFIAAALSILSYGWTWLPSLALGIWSYYFLSGLFEALLAPGVPVQFSYLARGGPVTIRAGSYAIDPQARRLVADRVRVTTGGEVERASAGRVLATYDGTTIRARIFALRATVNRERSGKFDVADLFPLETPERTALAYDVTVEDAQVAYRDFSTTKAFFERLSTKAFRIVTAGDALSAGGYIRTSYGVLPLRLTRSADSYALQTTLDRFEAAPFLGLIENTLPGGARANVAPLAAQSLVLKGPVRIVLLGNKPPLFSTRLAAVARGLTAGKLLRGFTGTASVDSIGTYARLNVSGSEPMRSASFDGALDWAAGFQAAGRFAMRAASRSALWEPLQPAVPRNLSFSGGTYSGVLRYGPRSYWLLGDARVAALQYAGQKFGASAGQLALASNFVQVKSDLLRWNDVPLSGWFQLQPSTGRLSGFANSRRLDLASLGHTYGIKGLRGYGEVTAALGGTSARPLADLQIAGSTALQMGDELRALGRFQGRGQLVGSTIRISRFALNGPNGAATAEGTVDMKTKRLAINARGGGIDVHRLTDQAEGLAFFFGSISGTTSRPDVDSRVEVYGAKVAQLNVPAAAANLTLTGDVVRASQLQASLGIGRATGELAWNRRTDALSGQLSAKDVQLADYLNESVFGLAALENGRVCGTLRKPVLQGDLRASNLVAERVNVESATARLTVTPKDLVADNIQVVVESAAEGRPQSKASGQATLNFEDRRLVASGRFDSLPLAALPFDQRETPLYGRASGTISATLSNGRLERMEAASAVAGLRVRNTSLGDGVLNVRSDGPLIQGRAIVGNPSRYISLADASYDTETRRASGTVTASNLNIPDLVQMFPDQLLTPGTEKARFFQSLSGAVSGRLAIRGQIDRPDVTEASLAAGNLSVYGRKAGLLTASATRTDGVWQIPSAQWREADTSLSVSGSVAEKGPLALDVELNNLDAGWLASIFPGAPIIAGKVDASLQGSGPSNDPRFTGTLAAKLLSDKPDQALALSMDTLAYTAGRLAGGGTFSYGGFGGTIQAALPLAAFAETQGPAAEPVSVRVDLADRDISELKPLIPNLDAARTKGSFGGFAQLTGAAGRYQLQGSLATKNGALGIEGLDTYLMAIDLNASLQGRELVLKASGSGSNGGSLASELVATLPDRFEQDLPAREVLRSIALRGTITTNSLEIQQALTGQPSLNGRADANLAVAGSLAEPKIGGTVALLGVDTGVPTEFKPRAGESSPIVNPTFDRIRVTVGDSMRVRSSVATMEMTGQGTLSGNLEYPVAEATMTLLRGTFQLPTARVELEPGGNLWFNYQGAPGSASAVSLDISLEGRTSVTASRFSGSLERYDVTLGLRGDILSPNGIVLTATSDPGDLSQDQILALLGQKDLIEGVVRDGLFRPGDALTRLALPTLLTPITQGIAGGLGLDYLALEYNALDQTVVTVAKTIGPGLTLIASRQLNGPINEKPLFDFRLTYRVPSRNPLLARTRLGIGFDQVRPWKITLDYTQRF